MTNKNLEPAETGRMTAADVLAYVAVQTRQLPWGIPIGANEDDVLTALRWGRNLTVTEGQQAIQNALAERRLAKGTDGMLYLPVFTGQPPTPSGAPAECVPCTPKAPR
jgi:hypothetical protein